MNRRRGLVRRAAPVAFAARELRTGTRGFRVFLACLAIGVGAIAAIGTVKASIEASLVRQGAALLGGDAEMHFSYRFASESERQWMDQNAEAVSEVVTFRSMAVVRPDDDSDARNGGNRALTTLKGIDNAYPLYGSPVLAPDVPLAEALADENGLPGAVLQREMAAHLQLQLGDVFSLGTQQFRYAATLVAEPDTTGFGSFLSPRTLVRTEALGASGLLGPGTLFNSHYRLRVPPNTDLASLKAAAATAFADSGMRWRDRTNPDPNTREMVARVAAFLVLAGLASLAVGGVGIASAVFSYLNSRIATIATLKTLGASSGTILLTYGIQISVMALIGVLVGTAAGTMAVAGLETTIVDRLPFSLPAFGVRATPLAEAALYGILIAAVFSLWPLAGASNIRAAQLFRESATGQGGHRPPLAAVLATAGLAGLLVGSAALLTGVAVITIWTTIAIAAALAVLALTALATTWLARRLSGWRGIRGRTAVRLAFGAVGGPSGETRIVILSLGLGLSVLAAIGQISANLNSTITEQLPDVAPSFFVIDIQNHQLSDLRERVSALPSVTRVDTAPMLRGFITRINGEDAVAVAGEHWVLEGDRGITFSDRMPENTVLTAGAWWSVDYAGPPLVSFGAEQAAELGISIGDVITINVLGRNIDATVASLRVVDFSTVGIGFIMSLNPGALSGAPHTHIATIYGDGSPASDNAIFREVTAAHPNITVISVRDGIERVARLVSGFVSAIRYAASATLVIGLIVLIGSAAAGETARSFEAAVLRTLGASRRQILASFAIRSALLGASAGLVAVFAGSIAAWAVMRFVMASDYRFEPDSGVLIVLGGTLLTLLAGLLFSARSLGASPARVLRAPE